MIRRAGLTTTGLVAALAALSACGGGDGGSSKAASKEQAGAEAERAPVRISKATSTIDVKAGDLFFEPEQYEAPSGTITFHFENVGAQIHTLRIDGEKGFKLTVPRKGDTDTDEIELHPGEYTLYCDVPGHRTVGMEAALVVT